MDIEGKVGWVAVSLCECESVIELRWGEERREKREERREKREESYDVR